MDLAPYASVLQASRKESHVTRVNVELGGVVVPVHVSVRWQHFCHTSIDFPYYTRTYSFQITKWMGAGLAPFLTKFHSFKPREAAYYGSIDAEGTYSGDITQKMNCRIRAAVDVIQCLNQILQKYQRSLLDFALRYTQEISPIPESYEHFITSVTCENILSSNFLQGEVKFEPFLFIDRVDRE